MSVYPTRFRVINYTFFGYHLHLFGYDLHFGDKCSRYIYSPLGKSVPQPGDPRTFPQSGRPVKTLVHWGLEPTNIIIMYTVSSAH